MRPFRPSPLILLALALPALGACAATQDALLGPRMDPMSYPSALVAAQQPVIVPQEVSTQPRANSLWRAGARTFFRIYL